MIRSFFFSLPQWNLLYLDMNETMSFQEMSIHVEIVAGGLNRERMKERCMKVMKKNEAYSITCSIFHDPNIHVNMYCVVFSCFELVCFAVLKIYILLVILTRLSLLNLQFYVVHRTTQKIIININSKLSKTEWSLKLSLAIFNSKYMNLVHFCCSLLYSNSNRSKLS